jgi:hypothetical protein
MIIFFGSRTGHLKTLKVQGHCKNCKRTDSVELIIYQKFAHIFFVPIFPIKKIYAAQCFQCKNLFTESEVKEWFALTYTNARRRVHSPLWSFTGLAAVFILVLLISILNYFRSIKNQYMIQMPKSGDIYRYKTEYGEFTLLRVSEVIGDTVYIFTNNYSTTTGTTIRRMIDQTEFDFKKEAIPKLRSDLIDMFENGEITDIKRE